MAGPFPLKNPFSPLRRNLRALFLFGMLPAVVCSEADQSPIPGGDLTPARVYSATRSESRQIARGFVLDSLRFSGRPADFRPSAGNSDDAIDSANAIDADELSFGLDLLRARSGRTWQAEERAFFYNYYRGFEAAPAAGLFDPGKLADLETFPSLRDASGSGASEAVDPIAGDAGSRYVWSGTPRQGLRIQLREGERLSDTIPDADSPRSELSIASVRELELRTPGLALAQEERRGLARLETWHGSAELLRDGKRYRGRIVLERWSLPLLNPFAEGEDRLWAGVVRYDLQLPARYRILAQSDMGPWLAPLSGGARALLLEDSGRSFPLALDLKARTQSSDESNSASAHDFSGTLQFAGGIEPDDANDDSAADADGTALCRIELNGRQRAQSASIARGPARLQALSGSLRCPGRSYPLRGLVQSWPPASGD